MIRRIVWEIINFCYVYLAKPLIFMMSADSVHGSMIRFASVMGRISFLRSLTEYTFLEKPNESLFQNLKDIKFTNPVGLAAGLDKNGEIVPTISALGFGFATVGSVTAQKCTGNPRPWFHRLPKTKSLVVNAGLANDGSEIVIKRLRSYDSESIGGMPVVLSVAKTNGSKVVSEREGINDYVTSLERTKDELSISMIEINISCPNAYGGEPFTTPERLDRLLSAVDKIGLKKPVFIKMPIDLSWDKFKELLDCIVNHKIAGVTIANLAKDRSKANLKESLPENIKGNLSGGPTFDLSNELIRQTYLSYGKKLTIIGVGGIFSAEDAYVKIKLGASLIEIITGMIFNGPQLAAQINNDLPRLLEQDGFTHISQAIGVEAKRE